LGVISIGSIPVAVPVNGKNLVAKHEPPLFVRIIGNQKKSAVFFKKMEKSGKF
jgi:hypothetical protein